MSELRQDQVGVTDPRVVKSAVERAPVAQNLQGVQVHGAPLTLAGRDMHNHTHHYYAGTMSYMSAPQALEHVDNQRSIQISTLGRATAGTGMWVRQFKNWAIWLDRNGLLRIMWGYGMPGAGKTILASIVIDLLEEHARSSLSSVCVCYIFFRYSDHTKATVLSLLEILVKQTLERHPECQAAFNKVYAQHMREKTRPNERELLELLGRFAKMMVTFYVLDALDEAPPKLRLELIKQLASINVKLFITSRPLEAIQASFPQAHQFPIAAQDHDIDLHISKEISCRADLCLLIQQGGTSLRDEIFSSIKEKCGGMFLHASLQLEALGECTSLHDVRETLAVFPTEINDMYARTWQRILSEAPSKVLLVMKVLTWILNATRSLSLEELQCAVATCPQTHMFEKSRLVEESTLVGLCRGLVIVEETLAPSRANGVVLERTRLVRLIHYTAKDALNRLIEETFPQPHSLLAGVCMARLTQCGLQRTDIDSAQGLHEALVSEPLLHYAYYSWADHVRASLKDRRAEAQAQKFVIGCHSFPIEFPHQYNNYSHARDGFDNLGPLHLVAFFNLPISLAGPKHLQAINIPTPRGGGVPLCFALMHPSLDALEELLRLPELDVNLVDGDGWTALHLAQHLHHEGVVPLLLDHPKIDINLRNNIGETAFHKARRGLLKLFLAHPDIDVNVQDRTGRTRLQTASEIGDEDTVGLLLAHPSTDVNARGNDGGTALHDAAQGGHKRTAQLLLSDPRVAVNAVDDHGQTALIVACSSGWSGHEGIVKLLLAHPRVSVNVQDKEGRTALHRVSGRGRENLVKLLLSHPQADVNVVDESGQTALSRAAAGGYEGTIKLLLTRAELQVGTKELEAAEALSFWTPKACQRITALLQDFMTLAGVD